MATQFEEALLKERLQEVAEMLDTPKAMSNVVILDPEHVRHVERRSSQSFQTLSLSRTFPAAPFVIRRSIL
jgi:hypothetical protein